jgi:hypothetical protein
VGLSLTELCIGLAILCLIVVAWRLWELGPTPDPILIVAAVVLLGSVVVVVVSAIGGGDEKEISAPDPQHEASSGKIIRVYNRVTSGPRRMREDDDYPVYLSTKPAPFCAERNCKIPETNRETGDTYDAAVCQRQGERVTNGQDTSRIDDDNPGLFSSRRYYGVRLDEDTFGYVSEVWIDPGDRGGLGLPSC